MSEWFKKEALDMPPMPAAEESLKPLPALEEERAAAPRPMPNPTGIPEPIEPMSLKSLAQLFETAAKAALDAKLNLEKAYIALAKVGTMKSQTSKDKEIATKTSAYTEEAKKLTNAIEALAKKIEEMRDGVSTPTSPWLE